jgi:toxin FitB
VRALLDTSVLVGGEQRRLTGPLPDEVAISVLTLAELLGSVLAAEADTRPRRIETLRRVESGFDPLPVDAAVARAFAEMAATSRQAGRRPGIVDMLIASTAVAHGLRLYTQDREQASLPGVDAVVV